MGKETSLTEIIKRKTDIMVVSHETDAARKTTKITDKRKKIRTQKVLE